jgi:hypothetical protein
MQRYYRHLETSKYNKIFENGLDDKLRLIKLD